jgi:hypothetical protein
MAAAPRVSLTVAVKPASARITITLVALQL